MIGLGPMSYATKFSNTCAINSNLSTTMKISQITLIHLHKNTPNNNLIIRLMEIYFIIFLLFHSTYRCVYIYSSKD